MKDSATRKEVTGLRESLRTLRYGECTYCGDTAGTLDHVVPHTWNNPGNARKMYDRRTVVPCCSDCNNLLNNKPYFSICTRAGYLSERLAIKHRKLLGSPVWSDEELMEISYILQESFKRTEQKRQKILRRITYCNLIASKEWLEIQHVWEAYATGVPLIEYIPEYLNYRQDGDRYSEELME